MNNYVVYKHTAPSGKCYIGITSQSINRRWRNGAGYKNNKYFTKAIEKYGWDNLKHEILFSGLSKIEAEQKEVLLIKQYDSANPDHGYNIDLGGNSTGKRSEATKEKLSAYNKAHPSTYWLGKHLSEEHRRNVGQSRTYPTGKDHIKSQKVFCGGNIFDSVHECAKFYNKSPSTIAGYCNGNKKVPQKWKDLNLSYL